MLLQPADVVFAFCPTGEGGGVDPTCSPANAGTGLKPKTAAGSSTWPEDVRKKLRALQSRLSRAKTTEAKAAVVLAINALIAEQSGVKAPAAPAGSRMSAKEALLEAAKHVPIKRLSGNDELEEQNTWGIRDAIAQYYFQTPSGRAFELKVEHGEIIFVDEEQEATVTGQGEAHFIFGEVTKAVAALATKTQIPTMRFSADSQSIGRQKLYDRLASSLATLVPGAKANIRRVPRTQSSNGWAEYNIKLREPRGISFAFCPTGEGGGVDPTCSPANSGGGRGPVPITRRPRQRRPGQPLRVNEWPEVDRRKLRALQSRLSRAVGEPAKAVVRAQIEALRARVQADADRVAAPVDRPGYRVLTEEIRANARTAATPAMPPGRVPPALRPPPAPKIRTKAEVEAHISNLVDKADYDEGWRPLTQQLEQLYEAGGEQQAGSMTNKTQLDVVMSNLFGSEGEDRANHAKLLLSAVGADKRITDRLDRADVQALAIGRSQHVLTLSLRGDGVHLTRILRNVANTKSAENALFTLRDSMQGDGTGVRVFSQQVDTLTKAGFQHVETTAARGGAYVGYKVWPKFGYDGTLNSQQVTSAKGAGVYKKGYTDKNGRAKEDFQATLETKEGQAWWTKYGEGKHIYFRLDDKKHASHSILKDYRDNKIKSLKEELKTAPVTAPAAETAYPSVPGQMTPREQTLARRAEANARTAARYTSMSTEQGERIRAAAAKRAAARLQRFPAVRT